MREKAKQSDLTGATVDLNNLMSKTVERGLNFFSSKTFLYLTLGWFALQGLYFAVFIKFGVPPDENYHLTYIKYFSEHFPTPFLPHQQGHDILLDAVHNPFFIYHYILSFPYKLVSGLDNAYIVIRLFNVGLGLASLVVLVKIADFIKINVLARNLSIFMLVNTLMFTFLFSAISYDNLFVFLSLASFLLLLRLIRKIDARDILLMLVVLLAGSLTKINFLPIAFIVCLIFSVKYVKSLPIVFKQFGKSFAVSKKLNYFLIVTIGLLSILFVQRYVFNLINYQDYAPSCPKVRTLQECRGSDLFRRDEIIFSANHPKAKKNIAQYSKNWVPLVEDRTFGVFAHKYLRASRLAVDWALVILLAGFYLLIVRWKKIDKNIKVLVYISLFYSGVLLIQSINLYHQTGRFGFAVHGRYLFCVLPIIYLVWNQLIIGALKRPSLKFSYLLITILIFFISAFPHFIKDSTADWYNNGKKAWINEK